MTMTATRSSLLIYATSILFFVAVCGATNFAQCNATVQAALVDGTITLGSLGDPRYHGLINGVNESSRPLTLTLEGCKKWCGGNTPQYSSSAEAFEILTTWVLPVITLLSSLPYESTSRRGFGNFEAFINWVGAPAATLSTTLWNIRMMHKCRLWSKKPKCDQERVIVNDTLYILSCINQYEYPRRDTSGEPYVRRDLALLRGTLYPYLDRCALDNEKRRQLANITQHLAFQLRLLRRRGVYPLAFGMFWFFLSLVFSIVISFDTSLGDNSEAHSLALGLLLAWLPVLVFTAYLDRNPVSSTRCAIMIERWLYQVERLFEKDLQGSGHRFDRASSTNISPQQVSSHANSSWKTAPTSVAGNVEQEMLKPSVKDNNGKIAAEYTERFADGGTIHNVSPTTENTADVQVGESESVALRYPNENPFKIGKFIGQGRKIRYCAVTDTVLGMAMDEGRLCQIPSLKDAEDFQQMLPKRPTSWYVVWSLSFLTVAIGFTTAFVIIYQTPPIGVGCRCLSYIIWYIPSVVSWALLGMYQEPGPKVRAMMWIANSLATMVIIAIMLLQVTSGLNNCWCKSVIFAPRPIPGYMDFDDGKWFQGASRVRETWGVATAVGLLGSIGALLWLTWGYEKDKSLWSVKEDMEIEEVEGVNLDWLR